MAGENKVKVFLSLNRPALERLLGGDGELEVAAREQIVDRFVDTYLKEAVERKLLASLNMHVNQMCETVLNSFMAKTGGAWSTTYTLSTVLKQRMAEAANGLVDEQIKASLAEALEVRMACWGKDIQALITRTVDAQLNAKKINELIDKGVQERLEMATSLCRTPKASRAIDLNPETRNDG